MENDTYKSPLDYLPYLMLFAIVAGIAIGYFGLLPDRLRFGKLGKKGYIEKCVDGVAYIDNGRSITPKLHLDKSLVSCHA